MPRFQPCPSCGEAVDRSADPPHTCSTERFMDAWMSELREELDLLEPQLRSWLSSPSGRADAWWAVREVRRRP